MKRSIVALSLLLILSLLAGCTGADPAPQPSIPESDPPAVTLPDDVPVEDITGESLAFSSEELGFTTHLPALLEGRFTEELTTRTDAQGEVISTIHITYQGAGDDAVVLSFEEMSTATWEAMKAEGGPLGVELGTSQGGRVVVFNSLQSNPYAEGSEDYALLQQFPEQRSVVVDHFTFLAP